MLVAPANRDIRAPETILEAGDRDALLHLA